MVYVLALGAALSNALTSVFQRMGVEDAPESSTMKLSLITHALRREFGFWASSLLCAGFFFKALPLHVGRLSVAQPIMTLELLFLVFILGTYFGYKVTAREWLGVTAIILGLAGFLAFAVPGGGERVPTNKGWVVGGAIAVSVIALGVVATRWGPRWWKAAM